jgi:hypothetical protein
MKEDFLADLIGNPEQARILRALVFNEEDRFTAAELGKRAGVTFAATEAQLQDLLKKGIVRQMKSGSAGNKTRKSLDATWSLNFNFKHLKALSVFVRKIAPMHFEEIIPALKGTGKLSTVVLSGSFMGDESRPADLLVAADSFNETRLDKAIRTLEPVFGTEIRYAAFSTPEFRYRITVSDKLIRDTLDFPHLVLLDRAGLLIS